MNEKEELLRELREHLESWKSQYGYEGEFDYLGIELLIEFWMIRHGFKDPMFKFKLEPSK